MALKTIFSIFFISMLVNGLAFGVTHFGAVQAELSISKPSVPEFAIETVSFPYDAPPTTTTTIDPYTGKETVTTQPGYHVENKTTQIRIKNQPFTPYQAEIDGVTWTINFFYNIRLKGHFSEEWRYYRYYNGSTDGNLRQSYDSEYTLVPIDDYLPTEGQVDFQIEALIGYEQGIVTVPGAPGTARIITGESSSWSSTQTLTIPASNSSPALQLEAIIGTAIVAVLLGAGLLLYFKKHNRGQLPMKRTTLALCLLIVLLATLMPLVQSNIVLANAESSISKPSVPEFTLKYVDNSYDVPATYSVDPYTGKNITHAGHRVENKSIEITVKNQPFTMYKLDNGQYANLFYNVSYRGHYGGGWEYSSYDRNADWFITQSDSEYTVISFYPVPTEGVMDFRVQAQIGYTTYYYMPFKVYEFHGETSGWSTTQTITIDGNAPTTTPTASPSQYSTATPDASGDVNQQGFNWTEISLFAALGVIAALLVVIALMYRKQTKK